MSSLQEIFDSTAISVLETEPFLRLLNDFGGDAQDALDIIGDWLSEMPGLVDQTRQAFADGDQPTVKSSAHTVKSAARSVGAMKMADMAEQLQFKAADQAITDEDEDLVNAYVAMAEQVVSDLRLLEQSLKSAQS